MGGGNSRVLVVVVLVLVLVVLVVLVGHDLSYPSSGGQGFHRLHRSLRCRGSLHLPLMLPKTSSGRADCGPEQQGYDNSAYVGVNFGFEIQIDELAPPDNALVHCTGAIYSFKGPTEYIIPRHMQGRTGADLTAVSVVAGLLWAHREP